MHIHSQPFDVKEQMQCILEQMEKMLEQSPTGMLLVGICGGTSTGKSTVVSDLVSSRFKGKTTIIGQDHFQYLLYKRDQLDPIYGLDHIHHYGIENCVEILKSLKQGQSPSMPLYDFKKREHVGQQVVRPNPVIIVEGLYGSFVQIQQHLDLTLYTEACAWERLMRRIVRNQYERYNGIPQDGNRSILSFMTRVYQAHVDFVRPQRESADFIINNPMRFGWLVDKHNIPTIQRDQSLVDSGVKPLWHRSFIDCQCEFQICSPKTGNLEVFRFTWGDLPYFECPIETHTAERMMKFRWVET